MSHSSLVTPSADVAQIAACVARVSAKSAPFARSSPPTCYNNSMRNSPRLAVARFFAFPCLSSAYSPSVLNVRRPAPKAPRPPLLPPISTRTASMTNMPGLLPLHWDANAGKLYLEIPVNAAGKSTDYLWTNSLPYGTASNDLGPRSRPDLRRPHRPLRARRPQGPAHRAQQRLPQLLHRPRRAAFRPPVVSILRPRRLHRRRAVAGRRHGRRHRLLPQGRPRASPRL